MARLTTELEPAGTSWDDGDGESPSFVDRLPRTDGPGEDNDNDNDPGDGPGPGRSSEAELASVGPPERCCTRRSCLRAAASCVRREPLLFLTLAGVIAGITIGPLVRLADPPAEVITLLGLPGELFLRALKMLVLPLVAGSIIGGVCSLRVGDGADASGLARVAWQTFLYYFVTTSLAVVLGIVMVTMFMPGEGVHLSDLGECEGTAVRPTGQNRTTTDALINVVRELVPPNIVGAAANMNILGILFFSLFFGISLSRLGPDGQTLVNGVTAFNAVISRMVNAVLLLSPVGIASLIIGTIASSCDPARTWSALGKFIMTVMLGLGVHGFVILPAIYAAITRCNPLAIYVGFSPALMTAFGTSSSSATLPLTMKCAEDNLGVDPNLAHFMLPIGATINMDGTALYEAVAAIFIAQAHDVPLDFGHRCVIAIVSTLAAVGAAAIPSAGLVTLIMVLQAAGLGEYTGTIAMILVVDWLLDRFRTCLNVLGDAFGVVMLQDLAAHRRARSLAPRRTTCPWISATAV